MERREKEWNARMGHDEQVDIQNQITPYNIIQKQVSSPQPLHIEKFPRVQRFLHKNERIIGNLE